MCESKRAPGGAGATRHSSSQHNGFKFELNKAITHLCLGEAWGARAERRPVLCEQFQLIHTVAKTSTVSGWESQSGELVIVPRELAETDTENVFQAFWFHQSDGRRQLLDLALHQRLSSECRNSRPHQANTPLIENHSHQTCGLLR